MKLSKNVKDTTKGIVLLFVAVQFADYAQELLKKLPSYPMDFIIRILICCLVAGFTGYFLSLVFWDNKK